jgi:hypothetical protein
MYAAVVDINRQKRNHWVRGLVIENLPAGRIVTTPTGPSSNFFWYSGFLNSFMSEWYGNMYAPAAGGLFFSAAITAASSGSLW